MFLEIYITGEKLALCVPLVVILVILIMQVKDPTKSIKKRIMRYHVDEKEIIISSSTIFVNRVLFIFLILIVLGMMIGMLTTDWG